MILFFGTRPGKQEIKPLTEIRCPYCNQNSSMTLHCQTNYFHLFWIKLFRISSSKTISCSHCKRTYFENEFTEEMRVALHGKETVQ
ncbi:MAG: zinc-ribbon domain-containing protein [Maribacter sp.]